MRAVNNFSRYILTGPQRAAIDAAVCALPEPLQHSFLLRCSAVLRLSGNAYVSDELVRKAIERGLRETRAMRQAA